MGMLLISYFTIIKQACQVVLTRSGKGIRIKSFCHFAIKGEKLNKVKKIKIKSLKMVGMHRGKGCVFGILGLSVIKFDL